MEIKIIPATSTEAYKLQRVAAYARISVDKDEDDAHSLDSQVEYYKDLIDNNPAWVLIGIYADKGASGMKDDRPEFQRMLADASVRGKMKLHHFEGKRRQKVHHLPTNKKLLFYN